MKNHYLPIWVGIAVLASLTATGSAAPPVMHEPATHEQLAQALRQAEQKDPMKNLPVSKGEDPLVLSPVKDLISQSDLISFQGVATLVPKRAILQIPKNYRDRMTLQPGVRIVGWTDFYAINRGWITTVEVSRTQAEGNIDLPDETHKLLSKCGNLVVATFMGGPISVLPLKVPETTDPKQPAGALPQKPEAPVTPKP